MYYVIMSSSSHHRVSQSTIPPSYVCMHSNIQTKQGTQNESSQIDTRSVNLPNASLSQCANEMFVHDDDDDDDVRSEGMRY
jgi:hypothetical protein